MESLLMIYFFALIVMSVLRFFVKKRLGLDQEQKAGVLVKKYEYWNSAISVAVIIVLVIFLQNTLDKLIYSVMGVFVLGNLIQIALEWKFLKNSRKYLMSIFDFLFLSIWIVAIYYSLWVEMKMLGL